MIIINNFKELNFQLEKIGYFDKKIGFVPTMGALHEGHASLLSASKEKAGVTVCSIFVNPLQFNNAQDYQLYPITVDNDITLLERLGCDILFLPSGEEMYPDASYEKKVYDLGTAGDILEGAFRPGHFQGVCAVMERLLLAIQPHLLFLGEKDYQQIIVIEKLISLIGVSVQVVRCPTLRESSGLAKSSRNTRLTNEQLAVAPELYKKLQHVKAKISSAPLPAILKEASDDLTTKGFLVEYIALAKAEDLQPVNEYDPEKKYRLLIAASLGSIRLIDNIAV